MKLRILIVIVVVAFLILSSCSNGTTGNSVQSPTPTSNAPPPSFQVPPSFTTYSDETALFSISYPNSWEKMPDEFLSSVVGQVKDTIYRINSGLPVDKATMLFASGLKIPTGYFPNLNIIVEPVPQSIISLDQAVSASIAGIKLLIKDYQEVSRVNTVINNKSATIIEYKGTLPSATTLSHNILLHIIHGKTLWSVTCSATDSIFSQWSSDFNNIVRSLVIKN